MPHPYHRFSILGLAEGMKDGVSEEIKKVMPYIEAKSTHCVIIKAQKQLQFSCKVKTVVDSSLTLSIA